MKKVVTAIILLVQFALATSVHAQTQNEAYVRTQLLEQISTLLQQITLLQNQLINKQMSGTAMRSIVLSKSADIEFRYRILNHGNFSNIEDIDRQKLIERFFELTPDDFYERFDEVVFFTDTQSNIDAFVETVPGMTGWRVGFEDTLANYNPKSQETTRLFIHEIGHLVAYEKVGNQTLLEIFENRFWNNSQTSTEFVSEYAKENAIEDFSESFMFYVGRSNYGGAATEKVQFFDGFELTRSYRSEIRSNI